MLALDQLPSESQRDAGANGKVICNGIIAPGNPVAKIIREI